MHDLTLFLSCSHTLPIKVLGDVIQISRKFTSGDHLPNSHDLGGSMSIDITRRNLLLIIVRA